MCLFSAEPTVHFDDEADCIRGEPSSITCHATGHPEPIVQIYKDDGLIDGSQVRYVYQITYKYRIIWPIRSRPFI